MFGSPMLSDEMSEDVGRAGRVHKLLYNHSLI